MLQKTFPLTGGRLGTSVCDTTVSKSEEWLKKLAVCYTTAEGKEETEK